MTIVEIGALCKTLLEQYESKLERRVRGQRPKPFDKRTAMSISQSCERWANHPIKEEVEGIICYVLDQLAEVKGKFVMSEPEPFTLSSTMGAAYHKNLNLWFATGWDGSQDMHNVKVRCWYYPLE